MHSKLFITIDWHLAIEWEESESLFVKIKNVKLWTMKILKNACRQNAGASFTPKLVVSNIK